ncbi:serine/threonine-protein kinase [Rhodopirellula baltica]|uniref:Serine/threonine-protein kinase n=1 Tax=Rhodopirellula baltica SWK14 TaxID=993516 RepID=L7C8S7_RHOBT|nr:serine/threonine-protein kinase [Rhodopirellula baltica]ELP30448.1 serine/threonine-protein kinase [Rhodopirellula baltica SWK14]
MTDPNAFFSEPTNRFGIPAVAPIQRPSNCQEQLRDPTAPVSFEEATGHSDCPAPSPARDLSSAKNFAAQEPFKGNARRYESLTEVGRGGWGIVEKAVDRHLEREVAIKRFSDCDQVTEQERQRFLHEAKVTSQLQHPGIVPVHEMGDEHDTFYVMKLLDGITLSEFIQQHHQSPRVREAKTPFQFGESLEPLLQRFVDICNAVAYAHQQGVVHRDLKPCNVMISGFGETVVLDWGLAHSAQQPEASSPLEPNGTVLGTPAYMSPEQARGETNRINSSSDLYSLGVVLYAIIAGHHPYHGQPVARILQQVRKPSCPDLRTSQPLVPKPLLSIVRKAIASSQHDRYASVEDLGNDVRRFIAGSSVSVHRENMIEKGMRWCRHHQGIAAATALTISGLLIAAIFFGLVIHQSHRAERLARIEAQRAHREAIVNLGEALDATDSWLDELSGSLQFYPGMSAIRSDLLERALRQYDRIAKQNPEITSSILSSNELEEFDLLKSRKQTAQLALLQRVKTQLRLADLHRIIGQTEQARQVYAFAESLLRTHDLDHQSSADLVSTRNSHNTFEVPFELERIHCLTGQLLLQDSSTRPSIERVLSARQWLTQHLGTFAGPSEEQQNAELDPITAKVAATYAQLELAIQTQSDPTILRRLGNTTSFQHAIDVARRLANLRGNVGDRRLAENIQTHLCRQWMQAESYAKAECGWSQLIADLHRWIDSSPDRIDLLQSYAHALHQRGNCQAKQNKQTEAIADLQSSLQVLKQAQRLTEMTPDQTQRLQQTQQDFDELRQATTTTTTIGTINNTVSVDTDFDESE